MVGNIFCSLRPNSIKSVKDFSLGTSFSASLYAYIPSKETTFLYRFSLSLSSIKLLKFCRIIFSYLHFFEYFFDVFYCSLLVNCVFSVCAKFPQVNNAIDKNTICNKCFFTQNVFFFIFSFKKCYIFIIITFFRFY